MSNGAVAALWKYPLKGARGEQPEFLAIHPDVGVIGDRQFAIRRSPGDLEAWAPKGEFFVGMNTPSMVAEPPSFALRPNAPRYILDPAYLHGLAGRLDIPGVPFVQNTHGEYNLCDTQDPCVSILNIASVRALSNFAGVEVAAERFRMNIWLTGLEPFEELAWVTEYPGGREIQIGPYSFRVDDACERCAATEANPETGERDLNTLRFLADMMRARGYRSPHRGVPTVMGVLAKPLTAAVIRRSDPVRFVE